MKRLILVAVVLALGAILIGCSIDCVIDPSPLPIPELKAGVGVFDNGQLLRAGADIKKE